MKDSGASAIQRILIVKPSSPGDIIHALPVARALRSALPNAHISWLVATSFANLLQCETSINEIIKFDRKRYGRFGRSLSASGAFLGFLNELRGRRFDTVLDLQGLFRSGLFTFATGAQRRVGFADARELAGMFYNVRVDVPDAEVHAVERNLLFLKALGIELGGTESESLKQRATESAGSRSLERGDDLGTGSTSTPRNHRLQTGATVQAVEKHRLQTDDTARSERNHRLQTGATALAGRASFDMGIRLMMTTTPRSRIFCNLTELSQGRDTLSWCRRRAGKPSNGMPRGSAPWRSGYSNGLG